MSPRVRLLVGRWMVGSLVSWLVGLAVINNDLKQHFHAPIGDLVPLSPSAYTIKPFPSTLKQWVFNSRRLSFACLLRLRTFTYSESFART